MENRVCTRCIMDVSDPEIEFDSHGHCNHCTKYLAVKSREEVLVSRDKLDLLVSQIKKSGKKNEYDCLIGLSGGVDSSYVVMLAKDLGLNPLIYHLDNGWNSEIAVQNINSLIDKTGFDLYTHVIDWGEFRDLQRAFFKANVVDIEMLTDHAIQAISWRLARKFNIKYIITGGNWVTEAILAKSWRHSKTDLTNLKNIYKKFGTKKLKTFPMIDPFRIAFFKGFLNIKRVPILHDTEYNKDAAIERLTREAGWVSYGAKHHESVFTRFYQSYLLPQKFGFDKRMAHLSCLIMSGDLTRAEALKIFSEPACSEKLVKQDIEFVRKKLGFTAEEFDAYLASPPVSHYEYGSNDGIVEFLLKIRKLLIGR